MNYDDYAEFDTICLSCEKEFVVLECDDMSCPECGGELEVASHCSHCGKAYLDEDLISGMCDDCIFEDAGDVDWCYYLSRKKEWDSPVMIDRLVAHFFSDEEINEILYRELRKCGCEIDCTDFIQEIKDDFAEAIVEERREDYAGWKERKQKE